MEKKHQILTKPLENYDFISFRFNANNGPLPTNEKVTIIDQRSHVSSDFFLSTINIYQRFERVS